MLMGLKDMEIVIELNIMENPRRLDIKSIFFRCYLILKPKEQLLK
jgi:hypothetical protein